MENNFQIDSASVSDRGLSKKRPQNEDSFLEMNSRGLFAVADGVGGAQAGDVASQMAMEILGEAFINLQENGDVEELMKVAIERANEAIFQMSNDLTQLSTMATTIVALHITGNIATIGHVGDSRLYRLDPKGNLYRETQDHSMVEEEVRAGRMTSAQAATHPSRNVISRALGADHAVEVDMKTIMFEPQTKFLLCSDGITRHIDDFELRDFLLLDESSDQIAQRMKDICFERGAEDNLTAVIAKVTDQIAGNFAAAANEIPEEFEAATVAAPRPAVVSSEPFYTEPTFEEVETPTQNFQIPVAEEIPPAEIQQQPEAVAPAGNNNPNSIFYQTEPAAVSPVQETEINEPLKSYRVEEKSGGSFGRIFTPLLSFLLGGIIFAGIYHLWAQNNLEPETPPMPPMQSSNIPLTSFEEARRTVDRNPQQYINANVVAPENAEDFYLMGRAFLLTGKFTEAKQMFVQAKDNLAQTGEVNSKVLANEITMSLAIINDPFAQKEFVRELNLNYPELNTNINANTSNSANRPQIFNGR